MDIQQTFGDARTCNLDVFLKIVVRSVNPKVVQYYQIYLSGARGVYVIGDDAEPLKLPEYPVQINELKAEEQRQNGSIRLFKVAGKADKGIMKVQINKQSKVKFLGAKYIDDERRPWWLHVVVDGEEGYLNDRNEMAHFGIALRLSGKRSGTIINNQYKSKS